MVRTALETVLGSSFTLDVVLAFIIPGRLALFLLNYIHCISLQILPSLHILLYRYLSSICANNPQKKGARQIFPGIMHSFACDPNVVMRIAC